MVRVNRPPGGDTNYNAASSRGCKTVRVLKPPGGGSSIIFGEDDSASKSAKAVPSPQPNGTSAAPPAKKGEAPPPPCGTSNGAAAVNGKCESPASQEAPGDSKRPEKPLNPGANGAVVDAGEKQNGAAGASKGDDSPPGSPTAVPTTPSIRPDNDTKFRLFGGEEEKASLPTPGQKKDHMRSSIFAAEERPKTDTPGKTDSGAATRKQRVPPGGFSSKLW